MMLIFGKHHHKSDDPWKDAPFWAIELYYLIFETQEKIMTALADLQSAVSDLGTQFAANNAAIDGLLTKITAAGTSDADVEAIVAQIRALITANQAEVAKITPA